MKDGKGHGKQYWEMTHSPAGRGAQAAEPLPRKLKVWKYQKDHL
jgi:hypothetical protein